ncbi:STAS domain-containing protein [Pseudoduganella sp. GCM10020061]|uniref:STAS domain-containing protein n=1 Tax=Pseudoduganella sp. GCM10020061 TaxID=3317345 RepID=UPI00363A5737
MEELATTQLIGDDALPDTAVEAESAPLAEEVALIWASGETELARHMLQGGLGADRATWWMLFDLYQIAGDQAAFDDLAIDYASRFETSPPTWKPLAYGGSAVVGVTPTEAFAGRLDAGVAPQVERLRGLKDARLRVRLEFDRVTDFDEEGCALVLAALQSLRARRAELVLSGAAHLCSLLRATLAVGRRDSGEAPWLLLLELQLLSGSEKAFEETAMDYCVTFEVSPPSFEKPAGVETAPASPARAATGDRFLLPATIGGDPHELLDQVDLYISQYDPAVLDCSHLVRVDYAAAGALLNRMRPLAGERRIELRDMNHLVAALFRLVGYADIVRMFPHKY